MIDQQQKYSIDFKSISIIILVVVVIALIVYIFQLKNNNSHIINHADNVVSANDTLENEVLKLENEIFQLETEINKMDSVLALSKKINKEQESKLKIIQEKIQYYVKKIEEIGLDPQKNPALQKRIAEKKLFLEHQQERYNEIIGIEPSTERFEDSNQAEKRNTRILRNRLDSISRVLEDLRTENKWMKNQLEQSRILSVSDFSYAATNKSGKIVSLTETRGKRIKSLQVRFALNRNSTTSPVTKEIFLIIYEPGRTNIFFTSHYWRILHVEWSEDPIFRQESSSL
jgi:hypothetical protein